jgi:hypothetical protein
MRWPPILLTGGLTIAIWTLVLRVVYLQRARRAADPPPGARRSDRAYTVAAIAATVGVTWFSVWLITDTIGPHWLHSLSLLAALFSIAIGAVLAGYAGWVGGP